MIVTSMVGPFNSIGGNPWMDNGDALGLGYSIYYYTTAMFPHQYVKMIPVEGVEPTADTIRARAYPLVAEVYAAVRKDLPSDAAARRLLDWLLTAEGQQAVAESGYVPLPR
jgi:ABC-type phosphate transport system substrate-binding protein